MFRGSRWLWTAVSLALCGTVGVAAQREPPTGQKATPRSVRDGLYTSAQASRGKDAYARACAECHMADLGGHDYAGPLAGFGFQLKWQDASLGELFGRIRSMPMGRPGSLTSQQYLDILAYILQENTYPAGESELTMALASQRWPRIPIERVVMK